MKVRNPGSNYLYADAEPYDNYYYGSKYMDAIKYLYNTISLHPLEFVKAAREETYNIGIEDIPSEVDLEPVVKEINKETNKFYFVYPPGFYRMVEECCLKEFNPYEKYNVTVPFLMKNNPGFMPKGTEASSFTQEFNADVNASYSHEGVDIAVSKAAIISGISGKVIVEGDKGNYSYGCFIVIKANEPYEDKNRYYLLGHLDRNKEHKKENDDVFPDEIVGYVGNTGHCKSNEKNIEAEENLDLREAGRGAHLHLQMFLTDSSPEDFIDIMEFEKKKNEKTKDSKIQCADRNIVNPFDYTEKYEKDTKK